MASRPTLGPEAEEAVEKVANARYDQKYRPEAIPWERQAEWFRENCRHTVRAVLTEASQSCPELLLGYALSEEERIHVRAVLAAQGKLLHQDCGDDCSHHTLLRKLDHGERDG